MPGKSEKAVFITVGVLSNSCRYVQVAGRSDKAILNTVEVVQACLNARGDEESIFSLVLRSCEARADMLKCQGDSSFHNCGGVVRLVQAWFGTRKDRESNFHHRVGAVKDVQACLSTCKDGESSFQHYGGVVKLVQAHFSPRKERESSFHHCGGAE